MRGSNNGTKEAVRTPLKGRYEHWSDRQQVIDGKLKVTLVPRGALAERICAEAAGVPAFYTATGVGTVVADGEEIRTFGDRTYLFEEALHADFALVRAWKGDPAGNLICRKTARDFNSTMATAAGIAIAEVEKLAEPGELDSDAVSALASMSSGSCVESDMKCISKGELHESTKGKANGKPC